MLAIDQELAELLRTSHAAEYRVSAYYNGQLRRSIPVTPDGSLRWNGDQDVQCSGTVYVAAGNDDLMPRSKADVLAPYGQELRIDRVDRKGTREWVTPIGQLRIQKLAPIRTLLRRYSPEQVQSMGWSAQVDVADRFSRIVNDKFLEPTGPEQGNTVDLELQKLSPIPVIGNPALPSGVVPSSLTAYPDSRMDAISALYEVVGARPSLTRLGVLTGRLKDVWLTASTPVFTIDGVIDMDDSMSNDLYNAVKVSTAGGSNDLYSIRQIDDPGDPLWVDGPMGRRVYTQSSPLYESQADLDAAADTILRRVSQRQSRTVTVKCLPQPHLELGDYVRARDTGTGREVDGEITSIDMPLKPTAAWTYGLIVAETR